MAESVPTANDARRGLYRVLLTLALTCALGCRDGVETLFDDARRAMEEDNIEHAARLYREVTIQAPDSALAAEAHFELARIYYLRLRDVEAARDSLIKVVQEYPGSPVDDDARRLLARLYDEELKDPQEALKHYRTLLAHDIDPDARRRTLLDIGHCHYELNELEASASAYRLALALPYHSDTDGAYMRLANLEWLMGSPDESLRLLQEVETRTTDEDRRLEALLSEVEILMGLAQFDEARERLRDARVSFSSAEQLEELEVRLQATEAEHRSLDDASGEALLQELQKKIRWGGGRPRRRAASGKP